MLEKSNLILLRKGKILLSPYLLHFIHIRDSCSLDISTLIKEFLASSPLSLSKILKWHFLLLKKKCLISYQFIFSRFTSLSGSLLPSCEDKFLPLVIKHLLQPEQRNCRECTWLFQVATAVSEDRMNQCCWQLGLHFNHTKLTTVVALDSARETFKPVNIPFALRNWIQYIYIYIDFLKKQIYFFTKLGLLSIS